MTGSDSVSSNKARAGNSDTSNRPGATAPTSSSPDLHAERSEPGIYIASNDRGARVRIGKPGTRHAFTPGELLQLAAASCSAISAEANLVHHLGEDFDASLTVEAVKNDEENRYDEIRTIFSPDMSSLDPERMEKLVGRLERAIERLCTVSRTLEHGAETRLEIKQK